MAPQLGMGTFRIEQFGYPRSYAMSDGRQQNGTEFWALPRPHGKLQPYVPTFIIPVPYRVASYDLDTFCHFLMDQGEDPANFVILYHYPINEVSCDQRAKPGRRRRKRK